MDENLLDRVAYATDKLEEFVAVGMAENQVRSLLKEIIGDTGLKQLDDVFSQLVDQQQSIGKTDGNTQSRTITTETTETIGDVQQADTTTAGRTQGLSSESAGVDPEIERTGDNPIGSSNTLPPEGERETTEESDTGTIEPDPTALVSALQSVTPQQRKDEQRKPYKQRNMLTAHFDQKATGKTNPLVLVKDFISQAVGVVLEKFTGNKVTEIQQKQLAHFTQFKDNLSKDIKATFRAKPENVMYKDFSNFLLNQEGQFDENTLTALALSAYSWFIEKGAKTHNSNDEILAMLHAP